MKKRIGYLIIFLVSLPTILLGYSYFANGFKSNRSNIKKIWINNLNPLRGELYIVTIKKNKMSYFVSNKNIKSNDFYINSNFFTESGHPIGEVIINHKKINNKTHGGGYFYSNGGAPNISFFNRPKNVKYSSQTILTGIRNGKICESITKNKLSKLKSYRAIIGINYLGDLIIIFSDDIGFLTIREICEIGVKNNIKNGVLFDGGSSIDVGINDGLSHFNFQTVSDFNKKLGGLHKPPVYIVGNFK